MATRRLSILSGLSPDTSGECFPEPYSILATNDQWGGMTYRFGSNNAAQPTVEHGIHGWFVVPETYVGTSVLVLFWTATITSGNVQWLFRYRARAAGEDMDATGQDESVSAADAAPGTAHLLQRHTDVLTEGNFTKGDLVEFYLARDGAAGGDTMAGSAILFEALFEYDDV